VPCLFFYPFDPALSMLPAFPTSNSLVFRRLLLTYPSHPPHPRTTTSYTQVPDFDELPMHHREENQVVCNCWVHLYCPPPRRPPPPTPRCGCRTRLATATLSPSIISLYADLFTHCTPYPVGSGCQPLIQPLSGWQGHHTVQADAAAGPANPDHQHCACTC
jgi:hypothetical protein